jgi:hypothetical protein
VINGIDDLLAECGPELALELFDDAESPSSQSRPNAQARQLAELCKDLELIHTPQNEGFARVPVDEQRKETLVLRSSGFRQWVTRRFYQAHRKPPSAQPLQDVIALLEARAHFEGREAELWVRVAPYQNRIYVDLCNNACEAVEITAEGWRVVVDPPVYFRRAKGMLPLPRPVGGGSLNLLRQFINVGNDHNWILCASWLVAALRPRGPYPVLVLQGEQGSAKSTMAKFLRRIVDPYVALVRTPPRDERDLVICANNSWVVAYDNLSGIPHWLSDSFCRLSTGGGFSTRLLYTDSEEQIFEAMRPVILNGIDHLPERADLADRALVLTLPHIPAEQRKDEDDLYAEFEAALPQVLGGLYTAVSVALHRRASIRLTSKPRMADFAAWATAAEPGLGFQDGAFMNAYLGNRAEAVQETVEGDPVGVAISALVDTLEGPIWEGTCKDLLPELQRLVSDSVKTSREWPRTPRALSGRLRRLAAFLREVGIAVEFGARAGKARPLTITRKHLISTVTSVTTVNSESGSELDQSLSGDRPSDGREDSVTVDGQPVDQPSLVGLAKPLKNEDGDLPVTEVTVMTVFCGDLLDRSGLPLEDRKNLCANCGAVYWQWNGSAWACPHCGEVARA